MFFFFFNDTATTEIYTLSLHDALPISPCARRARDLRCRGSPGRARCSPGTRARSEEHTSELQSQSNLVCRLLLEKKKPDTALGKHAHRDRARAFRNRTRLLNPCNTTSR